ncbi:MAG: DUF4382 domain-containing protein [Gemmatimonadota bacterium]
MQNHRTKWIPMILAAVLPMTACLDDEPTGPGEGMASLSVFITDAPGDVNRVWVELLSITAQGDEGGPVELLGAPTDLILLTDLVGTVQLLTLNAKLDPTTIRQLRLVVGDAVLESSEDTVYVKGDPVLPTVVENAKEIGELHCPSCSQSGIKVKIPNDEMEVEEGAAALVLDFDVAQSFGHKAGNSGKWIMHPVIHGTLVGDQDGDGDVLDELGSVSAISGTVALGTDVTIPVCPAGSPRSIKDFIPTATVNGLLDGEGQPIVRSGTVAEGGAFHIGFVPSLSYTMGYVGTLTLGTDQLSFTATVDPAQVTVAGAEVTGVAYTIQSALCQPGA